MRYYDWVYDGNDVATSAGPGKDYNNFYNRTIKQWTDSTDAAGVAYRTEETS